MNQKPTFESPLVSYRSMPKYTIVWLFAGLMYDAPYASRIWSLSGATSFALQAHRGMSFVSFDPPPVKKVTSFPGASFEAPMKVFEKKWYEEQTPGDTSQA